MQIGALDLPDELLTALEEKRLVIFAGAGVSKRAPSNLPNFQELVESIVGRVLKEDEVGQIDRVLGRAKEQKVPVHKLAAEKLDQPGSRFNSLHESLVGLFPAAAELRIVTTNFDRHFEGAIEDRRSFGGVEVFNAPAFPRGSSFTGLVHLHGTLRRDPEELVLTDADFGRAYLSEGWAGRFVVDLFREYTVLFVGYSYGDTVMSYLTRGLAPTSGRGRFALTETGKREHWELLGIEPIEYNPSDDHLALAEGLRQWASLERRGFLDWSQRLRTLVGREPAALAPDEHGELEFCLKNPKRAKLFYEYAKDPGWLRWAEGRDRLQVLFSPGGDQQHLWDLARWFLDDPLGSRGKLALKIALKETRTISPVLSHVVAKEVYRALAKLGTAGESEARRVAAWATILIERTVSNLLPRDMGHWLKHLSPQDHPKLVVQILAHLIRCQPVFREDALWGEYSETGLSVEIYNLDDHLNHLWIALRKHIDLLTLPLIPVLTEVLEARWRWQVALEGTKPNHDPWGWHRPWVERPPGETRSGGTRHDESVGTLVEIGKDILDELLARSPKQAAALIEQWLAAGAPQLIQLGLYGLAKSSQWKPREKLEILVVGHLPTFSPYLVEVFRVLQESYPRLSPRQRQRFLRRAKHLYMAQAQERDEPPGRRSAFYEWFNVLSWLKRHAPEDSLIDQAIAVVHQTYPEFQPREPTTPGLQVSPGWVQTKSHLSAQQIARLTPSQWFEELEHALNLQRAVASLEDHVGGFLEETALATSMDLEWGLSLTTHLLGADLQIHEVWHRILNKWAERAFTDTEWALVLTVLANPQLLIAQPLGITEVVTGRIKQKEPETTQKMVFSSLQLAETILSHTEGMGLPIRDVPYDWLLQAVNHPGGKLAQLLIFAIGELLPPNSAQGCGIPKVCKGLLAAIIAGTGTASAMGRIVLATRAHYFLWLDPTWTRHELLPLFDWQRDPQEANRSWQGFFFWGRPTPDLLEVLTPAAAQLADYLESFGDQREHYGEFIARAAYSLPDDPFSKEWFRAFLQKANDADRAHFAWELDKMLKPLQPTQKSELWQAWLKRYLEHRAQFPPQPEGKEFTALLGWASHLPEQLAELVPCLEAIPGPSASDQRLPWELGQDELPGSDPDLLARLLLVFLKRCQELEPWHRSDLHKAIHRLIAEGAQAHLINELIEKYLEHGGVRDHHELTEALQKREAGSQRPQALSAVSPATAPPGRSESSEEAAPDRSSG